jgi:hypothetical protein
LAKAAFLLLPDCFACADPVSFADPDFGESWRSRRQLSQAPDVPAKTARGPEFMVGAPGLSLPQAAEVN